MYKFDEDKTLKEIKKYSSIEIHVITLSRDSKT